LRTDHGIPWQVRRPGSDGDSPHRRKLYSQHDIARTGAPSKSGLDIAAMARFRIAIATAAIVESE